MSILYLYENHNFILKKYSLTNKKASMSHIWKCWYTNALLSNFQHVMENLALAQEKNLFVFSFNYKYFINYHLSNRRKAGISKFALLSVIPNFSGTRLYLNFFLWKSSKFCFKTLRFIDNISSTLFSLLVLSLTGKQQN